MSLLLGVFNIQEAKRIQAIFKQKEIELEMKFNDQTCSKGCNTTVELWGFEHDEGIIQEFFLKEQQRDLGGHEINIDQMNSVFDPNAESVTCQACGHNFKPTLSECPNCGLCY